MISDVLFDALAEIERYQNDPVFNNAYIEYKDRIDAVKSKMRGLMRELDTPPGAAQ